MSQIDDPRPALLVDAMSLFTRHYCAHPDMTTSGQHVGGVVGFLKTLRRLVSDLVPKEVVITWEGGGSTRRRALYSEYKAKRKPERLNRFYGDDIPDTEDNRVWQAGILAKLLRCLPVRQAYVADCEGDDVIAHLCRTRFRAGLRVIVSSDRDFYQLLDESTRIWSPQTKRLHGAEDVRKEHLGIFPRNFALAKALCGDRSDNVKGVPGLGFKTLTRRIPLFVEDRDLTIDDVLAWCSARRDEAKVMAATAASEDLIRLNWRLVYLGGRTLDAQQEARLETILAEPLVRPDVLSFMRGLAEVGVRTVDDPHGFCATFSALSRA